MKNILLPTDFSENSSNAIRYALDFFRGQACNFFFLNVQKPSEFMLDDFYTAPADASVNHTILADNKNQLEKFVAGFELEYGSENYDFKCQVDFDEITDSINQAVKLDSIDLIIMGTNGATGAAEIIFGSNTIKVIRKVNAPVLTIPEGYRYADVDTVLFSSKQGEKLSLEGVKPLLEIIGLKQPKVYALEISQSTSNMAHEDCFTEILPDVSYHSYKLHGISAPVAIDAFIQLNPVAMHAMFVARKNFAARILFGSDTAKISYHSQVPLLIMH